MWRRTTASTAIRLSITAIFTSLVFVATTIFSIYVPQTKGFFNIGETMVYTTALLFGPLVGAFAGGVGSSLADLFLGYPHYALATLVIKACEGALVGLFARKRLWVVPKAQWEEFTFRVGLVVGILVAYIGSVHYSGSMELYFGILAQSPSLTLFIPWEFWVTLGALAFTLVAFMGYVFEPEFGWFVFSILIGGSVMIAGYFLYQQFFLGVLAIAEIPVNIGQLTIGLIVALPIVRAIWRSLPSLKS